MTHAELPFKLSVATLLVIAFLSQLATGTIARAQAPGFQYRFRNVSIPAATADEPRANHFSASAAQDYLESGIQLWAGQKKCVSCHTHGIYMLTRPGLSEYWGKPSDEVRSFVVEQAREIMRGQATNESSPTQLAYTARGLAEWDASFRDETSPETDEVLRHVLSLQADDGSIKVRDRWPPLNSDTYHATVMAAMAAATAPAWRSNLQDEELLGRLQKLEAFLRETPPKHDHHGLLLLWAATRLPHLLAEEQRQALVNRVWRHQRQDGGWSILTFASPDSLGGGKRAERLKQERDFLNPPSDGYQTGLAVIVLREAGVRADEPRIQKAIRWLLSNQRESGRWWTRSLNTESRFHFITYSGTAYSALALAKCGALGPPPARRSD